MTDRDRLIELMQKQFTELYRDGDWNFNEMIVGVADHILADGWTRPPCVVGQTVYRVMADKRIKKPYEYKVIGFWYSDDETCNNLHLVRYVNGVFDSSMSVPFSEFNSVIFLTREEAEKALAKGAEK